MDETQQLKHRLAMVLDDMHFIRKHIEEHGLTETFEKPTSVCDYAWTHIHNIEIACDLNSDESLNWKPFNKPKYPDLDEYLMNSEEYTQEQRELIVDAVGKWKNNEL